MVDNKNKDFDDDAFDADDLAESDYDDAAFDEDLPPDEADLGEEGFDEDWQEDEEPAAKNKKSRSSSGEKKGLSFNTIVIIGAVIVGGGVLVMNVMSKTAEVKEAQGSKYQSIIDITSILDGSLFGKDTEPQENTQKKEGEDQQTGFLNAPDSESPPQPAPITPIEQAAPDQVPTGTDILTPMPEQNVAETPRGPEEQMPVIAQDQPAETAPAPVEAATTVPTAQDMLQHAKQMREKKAQENAKAVSEPAPAVPVAQVEEPAKPAPILAPAQPEPEEKPVVVEQTKTEDASAGTKILQALEDKIGQVLTRMDGIEKNINTVNEARQSDYKRLEDRMASMQKDIDGIKDRPVSASVSSSPEKISAPKPAAKKKVKKPAPVEDRAYYPSAQVAPAAPATTYPAAQTSVSTVWELRAAQPGRAWISKPGSKDMQGVVVGDNLPGVGQVTNILYQNGRWTVQGTKGQIFQ